MASETKTTPDLSGDDYEFPLSFSQLRLWFLDRLVRDNPFYNLPLAVRLQVALNRRAFGLALNEVVRRHDALRCAIEDRGMGEPAVIVRPFEPFPLPFVDISGLGPSSREDELKAIALKQAATPFDLSVAPLARYLLVELRPNEHVFFATMHHIVSDGWSLGLFWRELTSLYAAAAAGRPPDLPEPALQYGDFAVWQRERMSSLEFYRQRAFWHEAARDLPTLDLVTDFPRPPEPAHQGAVQPIELPARMTQQLTEFAAQSGATPFMVLVAALAAQLGRYADQSDVVLGTPVANRNRVELEGIIGFFVNSLLVRIKLDGDPTFSEVVRRSKAMLTGAFSNQDFPFEKLVEELQIARDPSRNPLFQISVQYFADAVRSGQRADPSPPAAKSNLVAVNRGTALFDMAWSLWQAGNAISGQIEFDTKLFEPGTVAAMAEAFRTFLMGALAHPQASIHSIPLISDERRTALVAQVARAGRIAGEAEMIWPRIKKIASAAPDTCALDGTVQLSYADLVGRVETVAAALLRLGVAIEEPVGVLMQRSHDSVIALLGILAAGAAFVPLSSDNPPAHTDAVLESRGCRFVITGGKYTPPTRTAKALPIGSLAEDTRGYECPLIHRAGLAYVIHTSGSTGAPKGVEQTHAALANQVAWMANEYGTGPGDRILFKTPLVFDASLWEVFVPLSVGATLVVAAPDAHTDPRLLVGEASVNLITDLQLVPSMLRMFLDEPGIGGCHALKRLYSGGEALHPSLARQFRETLPQVELINLYGPAETCIQSVAGRVPADITDIGVPLGAPVRGNTLYVLGPRMELVPDGMPGELWIGGEGMARGYASQPGATARSFLPNPFAAGGSRLYRTGDRVVRRPDGSLIYKGRVDTQIKFAGIRIDPGEIEAELLAHPEVRRAAVVFDGCGLKAHVETECGQHELRRHLQARLPRQLVPATIVTTSRLSLLESGKIDRKAMPVGRAGTETRVPIAPSDQIEATLVDIWAEVLDRPDVYADQDFFSDLGGHSLVAIRVIARIRELFGVNAPLRLIFENPTVQSLADALRRDPECGDRIREAELVLEVAE